MHPNVVRTQISALKTPTIITPWLDSKKKKLFFFPLDLIYMSVYFGTIYVIVGLFQSLSILLYSSS